MKTFLIEVTIDDDTVEEVAKCDIRSAIMNVIWVSGVRDVNPGEFICRYGDVTPELVNPVNEEARFKNYLRVLKKENKIRAIKEAKDHYLIGLKEAKNMIDNL